MDSGEVAGAGDRSTGRTWPFEGRPEPSARRRIKGPEDYLALHGEDTEAVVVRIGGHDAQLVLVAPTGAWDRWVYHSVEEATERAEVLGIPVHAGEFPEELRVKINAYRRPPAEYDEAAYPEQGKVGPVIEYPENRPRERAGRPEAERENRSKSS